MKEQDTKKLAQKDAAKRSAKGDKNARLAEALRENLRKRKQAAKKAKDS